MCSLAQSQCRSLLAARPSACMSDKLLSPSLTSRSRFGIPIYPIGTHVFTASESGEGKGDMQWSVVSLVGSSVGMTENSGD